MRGTAQEDETQVREPGNRSFGKLLRSYEDGAKIGENECGVGTTHCQWGKAHSLARGW